MPSSWTDRTRSHRQAASLRGAIFSTPLLRFGSLPLLVLALGTLSCSDRVTGAHPDQVIRVTDSNFIPGDLLLERGVLIEWQNASREPRTITSGHDADDPEAGQVFDVELAGYRSGEPIGGTYRRRFTEIDTIYYFSRHVPEDFTGNFAGKIIIR